MPSSLSNLFVFTKWMRDKSLNFSYQDKVWSTQYRWFHFDFTYRRRKEVVIETARTPAVKEWAKQYVSLNFLMRHIITVSNMKGTTWSVGNCDHLKVQIQLVNFFTKLHQSIKNKPAEIVDHSGKNISKCKEVIWCLCWDSLLLLLLFF